VYEYVSYNAPGVRFDYDEYASRSGALWEAAPHLRLMQGGVFDIRDSVTNICSDITLSSSTAARLLRLARSAVWQMIHTVGHTVILVAS
jgi:hypothetical protein